MGSHVTQTALRPKASDTPSPLFAIAENASDLVSKGVEVVKADLRDRASVAAAFEGAYGVFAMTQCARSNSGLHPS